MAVFIGLGSQTIVQICCLARRITLPFIYSTVYCLKITCAVFALASAFMFVYLIYLVV